MNPIIKKDASCYRNVCYSIVCWILRILGNPQAKRTHVISCIKHGSKTEYQKRPGAAAPGNIYCLYPENAWLESDIKHLEHKDSIRAEVLHILTDLSLSRFNA